MNGDAAPPQELVERALELSKADACVVVGDAVSDANLRWANNTLTTNGLTRRSQLTVIAVIGGAVGVTSRSGVTAETVESLVRAAERTASTGPEAEDQAQLVAGDANVGAWEDPPASTSGQVFRHVASGLGEAFARAESAGEVLFGYAEHEVRTTYLASSAGLRARHDQPTGHVELNAKSADFERSAWSGVATAAFTDVEIEPLTAELSRRLGWAARRVELPAGRYQTILPPTAVADLMIYLYWSAGAREAHDGRTVFSRAGGGTRVGERLAEIAVTLRSDPAAAGLQCWPFAVAHESSGSSSVFDNGLPLEPTSWIDRGVLNALIQTRHSAKLTDLPVTPYVDNLILEGPAGGADLDAMVADSRDPALLLTCLWYIREVDPQTLLLTGLTRDGVYLVEDGEVVGTVNNFRFNESPVDLLGRVVEVGACGPALPREWLDYFTRTAMPPLRVDGFNMSSVSQAS
jgi:predicted Zn-dependent protease